MECVVGSNTKMAEMVSDLAGRREGKSQSDSHGGVARAPSSGSVYDRHRRNRMECVVGTDSGMAKVVSDMAAVCQIAAWSDSHSSLEKTSTSGSIHYRHRRDSLERVVGTNSRMAEMVSDLAATREGQAGRHGHRGVAISATSRFVYDRRGWHCMERLVGGKSRMAEMVFDLAAGGEGGTGSRDRRSVALSAAP